MTSLDPPRVSFLIGGVQKSGTTALAHYLAQHPEVMLPQGKEAHVFDAPDFDEAWAATDIDARYTAHFVQTSQPRLCGDATPIYCLHPRFVARIARYNPAMRWIMLLRDPVERAISHYYMERGRGNETWPLLPALLLERWRLLGHADDFAFDSPLRTHSYRMRGNYARQLAVLYRHFPSQQVLLLESALLRNDPQHALQRVYAHLGLSQPIELPESLHAFVGGYTAPGRLSPSRCLATWLLAPSRRRLRRRYGITLTDAVSARR